MCCRCYKEHSADLKADCIDNKECPINALCSGSFNDTTNEMQNTCFCPSKKGC